MKVSPPGKGITRYAVEEIVAMFLKPYPESWWSVDELTTTPQGDAAFVTLYVRGIHSVHHDGPQTIKVEISVRGSDPEPTQTP